MSPVEAVLRLIQRCDEYLYSQRYGAPAERVKALRHAMVDVREALDKAHGGAAQPGGS